jgi:hypothetical protein
MALSRSADSQFRQLVDLLAFDETATPEEQIARLIHLQRSLDPENEFELILSWLGKCRLVHKLGQEQLPLSSPDEFRVPDLLAVFENESTLVPVLIEVKTSEPPDPSTLDLGKLSFSAKYAAYAKLLNLPLLIAWRHRGIWALFEARHAQLAEKNHKLSFDVAMKENLLSVLAGDFSYQLAPGTKMQMHIRKLTQPDSAGGFTGTITKAEFLGPSDRSLPEIPYLFWMFHFWPTGVETFDEGNTVIQSFVIPETRQSEFASRTLTHIVHAIGQYQRSSINWGSIVHDIKHLAHDKGSFRAAVVEGAGHGVITNFFKVVPNTPPAFL